MRAVAFVVDCRRSFVNVHVDGYAVVFALAMDFRHCNGFEFVAVGESECCIFLLI